MEAAGEVFGLGLSEVDAPVRDTLLGIGVACRLADLPMRDVTRTPLPEKWPLTSAAFGEEGLGLDDAIDRTMSYIDDVPIDGESRHGLLLVYAIPGYGKSFYCQTLYRGIRQTKNETTVPIAVTFNDHFKFDEDYDDDVRDALAVRMAFHFFVDHGAYGDFDGPADSANRVKAARRFRSKFGDAMAACGPESKSLALEVVESVNVATGSDKIIALIVDETAQITNTSQRKALTRCLKDVADCLSTRTRNEKTVGRVACVATGTTLASWRRAGFPGWFDPKTESSRDVIYLGLLGAVADFVRQRIVERVVRQTGNIGLSQRRIDNVANVLSALGSGHWRTYDYIYSALADDLDAALSTVASRSLESTIIELVSERATKFWSGPSTYEDMEAFAFLLALSNLYEPCFPQDDLSIAHAGGMKVADWRERLRDLQPIKQETFDAKIPGDEAQVVPRFSLYSVRAYAIGGIYSKFSDHHVPLVLRKFFRHLYALLTTTDLHNIHAGPFWERWEYDLAHMLRLKFISLYLKRAQSWRKATGQFAMWPASEDLQTVDETVPLSSASIDETEAGLALLQGFETVGQLADAKILLSSNFSGTPHCEALDAELWITDRAITDTYERGNLINSAIADRGDFRTIFPAKILDGYRVAGNWSDAIAAVLSRSLRPGDVLVLGDSSIGVDVVALVRLASDGNRPERNGLVFFQAKWQYGESRNKGRRQKNKE